MKRIMIDAAAIAADREGCLGAAGMQYVREAADSVEIHNYDGIHEVIHCGHCKADFKYGPTGRRLHAPTCPVYLYATGQSPSPSRAAGR